LTVPAGSSLGVDYITPEIYAAANAGSITISSSTALKDFNDSTLDMSSISSYVASDGIMGPIGSSPSATELRTTIATLADRVKKLENFVKAELSVIFTELDKRKL
jgi:hypothetical protein